MTAGSIGAVVDAAAKRLTSAGIPAARREARLLLAAVLVTDQTALLAYPERSVSPENAQAFEALVERRLAGAPLSRLLGHREFWSLPFALSPDTLDPRPDSETLIEAALDWVGDRDRACRVLDFGTGSGCLLLAILSALPRATGIGVDRALGAATMARRNAAALGFEGRASFVVGDWGRCLKGEADLILANPPYIPSRDIAALAPEVRDHDPRLALDGGADGLEPYRSLVFDVRRLLSKDGSAFFEIGEGQAQGVSEIFAEGGLKVRLVRRDLSGIERCIVASLP